MARSRFFWLLFAALGLGGALAAVRLFSVALPNIALEVSMDRGEALEAAAGLAERYDWGAADDRSAASFGLVDPEVQTYVELEGGGREVFAGLAERGLYTPHQWRVRRFAERRVEEAVASFTPQGEAYGFRLTLAEDDPAGGNLDAVAARALAQETAGAWGVGLAAYRLLESSQETLPGGRVEHTIVYERVDAAAGEARFRLRLRIAGARPAELTHYVYVPEAFSRRYADMRGTNDTIALVSQAVFMLLFVLLGAGLGSALLLRSGWIEWRAPLAWGAGIAFLFGLNTVNQLPLTWMAYDTALSSTNFVLQQLGAGVAIGLLGTPLIGFFLLAGESLGRRAFADHVQQWRFWSPEVASSTTAVGMTVAAYLLVGIQLGYVIFFYLGTQRLDGWWSPADALVQPDLLATYLPWLQAVSIALFASFWEESVFRAVPIACAALLGARYGRRGLWIGGAVLLQAVVFAAAHANYPQQPPYARVVELTGPALLWGIVYVRYGLVPTILAHFLYDLSLFSVVLFESDAPLDQAVIVAVALVPLAVVATARWRFGTRARPPEWAYNRAWKPVSRTTAEPMEAPAAQESAPAAAGPPESASPSRPPAAWTPTRSWVGAGAGVGAILYVAAWAVSDPPPGLWGTKSAALAVGRAELAAAGVSVETRRLHVAATPGPTEGREYVWEEGGPEAYASLAGVYFDDPRWLVRLVNWDADPEARVEEYRVWIGAQGRVTRLHHVVPEGREGPALEVDSARALALGAVTTRLGLPPSALREVEADETSLPGRRDWAFTFTEVGLLEGIEGEARIQVRIAGDEVVDVARGVRVPEEWSRARRQVESRRTIMAGGFGLLLAVAFGGAAISGIVAWSRGRLAAGLGSRLALPVVAAIALAALNGWPSTVATFNTAQPWGFQAGSLVIALVVAVAVAAPAVGLVGALAVTWLRALPRSPWPRGGAVALGLLLGGGVTLTRALLSGPPGAGDYSGAGALLPALDAPLGSITPYLLVTAGAWMVVAARRRYHDRPMVQSGLLTLLVIGALVLVPAPLQDSLPLWALAALLGSLLLYLVLRFASDDAALVPGAVGVVVALAGLERAWQAPHAGARTGGLLAALVVLLLAWAATRLLTRPEPPAGAGAQSLERTGVSVGSV